MRTISPKVLLKPIEHKNTITLSNGLELYIASHLSQNAREALIQVGEVVATFDGYVKDYDCDDKYENELSVGDLVVCTHFAFYQTTSNKNGTGYAPRDSVSVNGVDCFDVDYRECYFKIDGDKLIALNNYMLVDGIYEDLFVSEFLVSPNKELRKDKAKVVVTTKNSKYNVDDIVYLLDEYCMYKFELGGNVYYRIREREICAIEVYD